jgi:uncharacterized repeat protein (TIGR01451 family)
VKRPFTTNTLLMIGMALLLLSIAPKLAPTAHAIRLAALTPTAEPPTRTPALGSTDTPGPTLPPRPTVLPTNTPIAADTPAPQPTRKPDTERADPAVTKSVSPSEARVGDIVDFTITVTNHGGETADDVVVTDVLPDFLDVVETTTTKGTIAASGRTVVVTIGTVAPDEVVIIHIRARVNEQALPPGGRNSVTLSSSNNSDAPENNTSAAPISILSPAASPVVTPAEVLGTPAGGEPSATPASAAGGASRSGQPVLSSRPNLPRTGEDERRDISWPLALLGLVAIAASLLLRRRGAARS